MTTSRTAILDSIRRHLHRGPLSDARADALRRDLARPCRQVVPARGQGNAAEQVALFLRMAGELAATSARLHHGDEVPAAVAAYLESQGLAGPVRVAPELSRLPWAGDVVFGAADPGDAVSVTPAFAGVAETGTLVLLSGPASPTGLNFLPDTHIVVLAAVDVVGAYEDVWDWLRGAPLPRSVNLISGPSRTGDIEQTIQLGAHGPRRLHILLIDDQPAS